MTIQLTVSVEDLVAEFDRNPDKLLDLLAGLANQDTEDELIAQVTLAHSGSLHHDLVAPFLHRLADALVAIEWGA